MRPHKYCPVCGESNFEEIVESGRLRAACSGCGWIKYENPLPAVAALVTNSQDELLLVKRAIPPWEGEWCLPGGFIEIDEALKDAGARELKEETGLDAVKTGEVIDATIQISDTYRSVLIVGIEYFVDPNETLRPGDDAMEASFFPVNDLPDLPLESHRYLIQNYLHRGNQ